MPAIFLKRTNQILLFIALASGILYFARSLLIPLALGSLLAMLLLPVCRWFERHRLPRGASVSLSLFLFMLLLAGVMMLVISQVTSFSDDLPEMKGKANQRLDEMQDYIDTWFNIPPGEQSKYLQDSLNDLFNSIGQYVQMVIGAISQSLLFSLITLVYIFLILFYRWRIVEFILQLMGDKHREEGYQVIKKSVSVAASYLGGVLIVVAILATIDSIGLLILGIPNALFFGIMAGILNIIPYIGSFIGSILPVIFALLMKDSAWIPITTIALFVVTQLLESYVLTPNITGSKISLNPLATIIALLMGKLIWGIAGMILFIPLLGIAKVIMENVKWLRPLGFLIGTRLPDQEKPQHEDVLYP